jgi:hypothetical protein
MKPFKAKNYSTADPLKYPKRDTYLLGLPVLMTSDDRLSHRRGKLFNPYLKLLLRKPASHQAVTQAAPPTPGIEMSDSGCIFHLNGLHAAYLRDISARFPYREISARVVVQPYFLAASSCHRLSNGFLHLMTVPPVLSTLVSGIKCIFMWLQAVSWRRWNGCTALVDAYGLAFRHLGHVQSLQKLHYALKRASFEILYWIDA